MRTSGAENKVHVEVLKVQFTPQTLGAGFRSDSIPIDCHVKMSTSQLAYSGFWCILSA